MTADPVIQYLNQCPAAIAGSGGHPQTFKVACSIIQRFDLTESQALAYITDHYNPRCVPPWSQRDIQHKIADAMKAERRLERSTATADTPPPRPRSRDYYLRTQREPRADPARTAMIFLRGFSCTADEIREASPYKIPPMVRPDGNRFYHQAPYLIRTLFDTDDWLVIADVTEKKTPRHQAIRQRNQWEKILTNEPLPPCDFGYWIKINGMKEDTKPPGRDENVRAYKYALTEWDDLDLNIQFSLAARLPIPIAAIVTSGDKSVHLWLKVDADDLDDFEKGMSRIYHKLSGLGIDPKNRNSARYCRLPGVPRGNSFQELLYLDPDPNGKPIL